MITGLIKQHYRVLSMAVIGLVIAVLVFFGFKKQAFYIDEYYLYTFANGTQLGLGITPGEWNDTSEYIDQLVSVGDENFHFKQVYLNTETGVHPPLYYFLLHFVSSIFSGVFSKWLGLSINICLMIPILLLVRSLSFKLSDGNEAISLLTMILVGLTPATISVAMLIRMYLLLTLWTLLYAYIHVRDLERDKLSISGFLVPAFICGFLGFLTQYFFVVIMFFITFVYAFYLLVFCHRVRDTLVYGTTALISLICTYFVWPISYFHIFKGYRGQGAVSRLRDISHIWDRLWTHFQYLNKLVTCGFLPLFMVLLIVGVVLILKRLIQYKKEGRTPVMQSLSVSVRGIILLSIASLLCFLVLTQIALPDGGIICSRQLYMVYALFLTLIPVGTYRLLRWWTKKDSGLSVIVPLIVTVFILASGFIQHSVLFLYEEEIVAMNYAREHPDSTVVMFQMDDGNYDSRIQELMMYPEVYYVSAKDLSTAKDDRIATADELLVYVSTSADKEACFESIYSQNPKITKADHLWDSNMFFTVYLLH